MGSNTLTLILLLILTLLEAQSHHAHAAHVACSWKLGPGSPQDYGYEHFCQAELGSGPEWRQYKCSQNYAGTPGVMVASWGWNLGRTLDFGETSSSAL